MVPVRVAERPGAKSVAATEATTCKAAVSKSKGKYCNRPTLWACSTGNQDVCSVLLLSLRPDAANVRPCQLFKRLYLMLGHALPPWVNVPVNLSRSAA